MKTGGSLTQTVSTSTYLGNFVGLQNLFVYKFRMFTNPEDLIMPSGLQIQKVYKSCKVNKSC